MLNGGKNTSERERYHRRITKTKARKTTCLKDPLLAANKALEWLTLFYVPRVLLLYYGRLHWRTEAKRETTLPLLPGNIPEF